MKQSYSERFLGKNVEDESFRVHDKGVKIYLFFNIQHHSPKFRHLPKISIEKSIGSRLKRLATSSVSKIYQTNFSAQVWLKT